MRSLPVLSPTRSFPTCHQTTWPMSFIHLDRLASQKEPWSSMHKSHGSSLRPPACTTFRNTTPGPCSTLLHAFDVSVWEIWGAFCFGGKLVVLSYDIVCSPQGLYRIACEQHVTVFSATPKRFQVHSPSSRQRRTTGTICVYVILAGEAPAPGILRPWFMTHDQDRPKKS